MNGVGRRCGERGLEARGQRQAPTVGRVCMAFAGQGARRRLHQLYQHLAAAGAQEVWDQAAQHVAQDYRGGARADGRRGTVRQVPHAQLRGGWGGLGGWGHAGG